MSDTKQDTLEELLRHAAPRPVPNPDDVAVAKAAVRNDWIDATSRHNRQRRTILLATAATVLVGIFAALSSLQISQQSPVQLAAIQKSFGPVFFLGEEAELRPTEDLSVVMSGQTIVTGNEAGLALAWGSGGSLRVDANTRLRFESDGAVFLETGRVYFDSQPGLSASIVGGDATAFELSTDHGMVKHVGTQYMTSVDTESLVVSVREGAVQNDGHAYDQTVETGEQATLIGRQRPNLLRINPYGGAWSWVTGTTPAADVDGKSLHEFLVWVSRELGLELRFEGRSEAVAQSAVLKGTIDAEPADALRLRLASAALDWRIEGGVIYITE